jgi:RecG-like helicase
MFGSRQSGVMSHGIAALAMDTQMLKQTHDEARALLKNPDSEEAQAVMALAREVFAEKMHTIALN